MNRNQAILEIAQEAGSKSKTVRGCTRYILRCTGNWQRRGMIRRLLHLTLYVTTPWVSPNRTERLEHPEAMRAKADKVYRRNFLRRINARVKRLYQLPSSDYGMLGAVAKFQSGHKDRSTEMDKLQYDYHTVTGKWLTVPKRNHAPLRWNRSDLTGHYDPARYGFKHRGSDAPVCKSTYAVAPHWDKEDSETTWKNGRAVAYRRVCYTWSLNAFGAIDDAGVLHWQFGYDIGTKVAPDGWKWDVDSLGIRLVSCSDSAVDLHVSMCHMLDAEVADLVAFAEHNAEVRRQEDQARAAQKALYEQDQQQKAEMQRTIDSGELYVCLEDSYSSGNCKSGTLTWVDRYFKRTLRMGKRAVPAKMVDKIKDSHWHISRAISAAYVRHMRSLDVGYSQLS